MESIVPDKSDAETPGLWRTLWLVCALPEGFFDRPEDKRSLWHPIAFTAAVWALIGAVLSVALVVWAGGAPMIPFALGVPPTLAAIFVLAALLRGVVAHAVIRVFGPRDATFSRTLAIFGFVDGMVPVLLIPLIGPVWQAWVSTVGLRRTFGVRTSIAVLAGVLPLGAAFGSTYAIKTWGFEAFRMPSSSMCPTLLPGDHFFVRKFAYGFGPSGREVPARGDVIIFNGADGGDAFIKRVVGLPGDRVLVQRGKVTICPPGDGACAPLPVRTIGPWLAEDATEEDPTFTEFEEKLGSHTHRALVVDRSWSPDADGGWTVEPGHVFVLGDHRDNSLDSRFGPPGMGPGQIAIENVLGRADLIWLSLGPDGIRADRLFTFVE